MKDLKLFLIENESSVRLLFFLSFIFIMGSLEYLIPKVLKNTNKIKRWFCNFSLIFLSSMFTKLILPFAAISTSLYVTNNSIGLFSYINMPFFLDIIFSIIFLDFVIYLQHRFFHKSAFFWNFHKVHHSDLNYDLSTSVRFHPIEIMFSMIIKVSVIFMFGIPLVAVIIFEIILSSLAIFNHSNIKINEKFDKILRYFIVTPNMHRIHHSIESCELNSNYGFNISLWDRLFKTYTKRAKKKDIVIGLKNYQNEKEMNSLLSLLLLPFKKVKN